MEKRFKVDAEAELVVDESERERWVSFGLTERKAQDDVFRAMARAVGFLTAHDGVDWKPASDLLARSDELRATDA